MTRLLGPILLAIGAVFGAKTASAEPLRVISGEHAAFSRIVTPHGGAPWQITQSGRKVTLSLEGSTKGFDTRGVFDLIPRTRLATIGSTDGTLTLTLACDCVVSAFAVQDQFVAIDIAADKDALQTPVVENTAVTDTAVATAPKPVAPPLRQPRAVQIPAVPGQGALPPQTASILSDVQDRLADEVTTAAARGLLQPAPNLTPRAQSRPQIDTRVFYEPVERSSPAVTPAEDIAPGTNLRISTSRDLPQTFRDLAEIVGASGLSCLPDSTLAIGEWGDNSSFSQQMAAARSGLYGEFDRIDPKVALTLARTYLYFGFGAEAQDILRLDPALAKRAAPLIVMAKILDGDPLPAQNALSNLAGCQGEAALWALLALPDPPQGALPPSRPALLALNALPAHLRTILAPRLSAVLRSYGDPDGAATALQNLDRLPDALPPDAKMAQAAIDLDQGDTQAGTEKLSQIAESNAAQSPDALIALVDAKIAAGDPIQPDVADLIEAYERELRDTDAGPALHRAHILALADSGQFDAAFEKRSPGPKLTAQLLRKLTETADDITFLEHSFAQGSSVIRAMPPDAIIALADRQLALGFADHAERTLTNLSARPFREARQLLSARIALAMGKPLKANAELLDVTSTAADRLRADAKRMSGAHDEAHRLYTRSNQTQDAVETAWLSDDWRTLTPADAPVFGQVSQLAPPQQSSTAPTEGMLSRSAAILEETVQTRETLQSMLQADRLQVGSDDGS